jgi:hypothetical protein
MLRRIFILSIVIFCSCNKYDNSVKTGDYTLVYKHKKRHNLYYDVHITLLKDSTFEYIESFIRINRISFTIIK